MEFKKFSERRGGSEPDGKPRFRSLDYFYGQTGARRNIIPALLLYSNLNDYMITYGYMLDVGMMGVVSILFCEKLI